VVQPPNPGHLSYLVLQKCSGGFVWPFPYCWCRTHLEHHLMLPQVSNASDFPCFLAYPFFPLLALCGRFSPVSPELKAEVANASKMNPVLATLLKLLLCPLSTSVPLMGRAVVLCV
jgi:hypothetical protein